MRAASGPPLSMLTIFHLLYFFVTICPSDFIILSESLLQNNDELLIEMLLFVTVLLLFIPCFTSATALVLTQPSCLGRISSPQHLLMFALDSALL